MPRLSFKFIDREAKEWLVSVSLTELAIIGLALGVTIVSLWRLFA